VLKQGLTLALLRLRQGDARGRAEAERLCVQARGLPYDDVQAAAAMLAPGNGGPDNRATVLATIDLARRMLGQPYADQLAEAIALSPDADLVTEAQRNQTPVVAG
jgi:hypothetical protein